MYVIWSDKRKAFKTYDGWTQLIKDKHGERIDGLQDVQRFTANERDANASHLPATQSFVPFRGPISWEDFK